MSSSQLPEGILRALGLPRDGQVPEGILRAMRVPRDVLEDTQWEIEGMIAWLKKKREKTSSEDASQCYSRMVCVLEEALEDLRSADTNAEIHQIKRRAYVEAKNIELRHVAESQPTQLQAQQQQPPPQSQQTQDSPPQPADQTEVVVKTEIVDTGRQVAQGSAASTAGQEKEVAPYNPVEAHAQSHRALQDASAHLTMT